MKHKHSLKKDQIQTLFNSGQLMKTTSLICYWQKKKEAKIKIAFSVSKKIKNNCQKNLIKRQLRMIAQQKIDKLMPINLILIAKKNYFQSTFAMVEKEIEIICKEIKDKSNVQENEG